MQFEYDPNKSRLNKEKHGFDFEEAKELWNDPGAIIIPLNYKDEKRYLVTGIFKEKHWSAICTNRDGNIRIISFRRAHKKEEEIYEKSNR